MAGRYLLVTAAASLLALALLAKVGEDVFEHESGSFDGHIRGWMLAHRTPVWYTVFLWITRIGSTVPMVIAGIVIGLVLWRRLGRHVGGGIIVAPTISVAIYNATKFIFARQRPAGAKAVGILTYSFPSGHATTATAVAPIVAYVLWREGLLNGPTALGIAVLVPLLVGMSRVVLDVHWATDVLGAWCIGVIIFGFAAFAYERRRHQAVMHGEYPKPALVLPSGG